MIRFVLIFGALAACALVIAAHGVRGVIIIVVLAALASILRLPAFQGAARLLVRITGSPRRALVLVTSVTIGVMLAINLYQLVR